MDFIKKGTISTKYLSDGCEFKKDKNNFKLISTLNDKYAPFVGQSFSEDAWDMISRADITSGEKHDRLYSLLLDHFKSGQTIFSKDVNILLKKDERVIFKSLNNIVLREPKSVRVNNSVHVGSARRRKNHTFGVGASKSIGESHDVIKDIDIGQIIITNKRFIFTGSKKMVDVNISQIIGITPYNDAIQLQRKGKQKAEYFVNVNNFVFNYRFGNENYFFRVNGSMVKSMIEGGLNKTPQKSKLQIATSQLELDDKKNIELIPFEYENLSLKYPSNWRKIANKKGNRLLSIERIIGFTRCELFVSKNKIPSDMDSFKEEIKSILSRQGFEISQMEDNNINGIDMFIFSGVKKIEDKNIEVINTFFNDSNYQFGIFMSHELGSSAKDDYDNLLKSIVLVVQDKSKAIDEDIGPKINFCPNCGTKIINENENFCHNCGFKLN